MLHMQPKHKQSTSSDIMQVGSDGQGMHIAYAGGI